MNMKDLAALGAGFSSASFGSQAVFRAALHALSHPGEMVFVRHDAQTPSAGHSASAALLLALLDPDSKLWLSPTLAASGAASWLKFHTGCTLVTEPHAAQFAWIGVADALPQLDSFSQGSDTYPDQSATCIVDVASLTNDQSDSALLFSGPGIRERNTLAVGGLAETFVDEWKRNHDRFPQGIDVFLCAPECIVGLPRTTHIASFAELEV
jgi:alpha-D-ribose 1-methylphosphonate 5-triphosphate synthase subunit PhnH